MEIDEFTEQLMERAKVRKEYLRKKMSELRKRTALVDENQLPESIDCADKQDDSPKRQRLVEPIDESIKVKNYPNVDNYNKVVGQEIKDDIRDREMDDIAYIDESEDDDEEEDKENVQNTSESSLFVPYTSYGAKGLAALKRNKGDVPTQTNENERRLDKESSDEAQVTNFSQSQRQSSHRSRLASLADDIRQWEEDGYSATKSNKVTCPSQSKSDPFRKPSSTNSRFPANSATNTKTASSVYASSVDKPAKHVSFHPSCGVLGNSKGSDDLNESFGFESVKKRLGKKLDINDCQVQKVKVWDKAILNTLESQGYVKSQSSSKLIYDFKEKSEKHVMDVKNKSNSKNQLSPVTSNDRTNIKSVSPAKKTVSPAAVLKNDLQTQSKDVKAADPAELPLSARKALFEKAFQLGSDKLNEENAAEKMSVAQRAALFEQTSKTPVQKGFLKEPQKLHNRQSSQSPTKSMESKSPAKSNLGPNSERVKLSPSPAKPKTHPSPSKNAGPHTRLMQHQLVQNSTNDWKNKETVVKGNDERKNEISSLLSHWEKLSSVNYETTHLQEPAYNDRERKQSSSSEKYSTVFEEPEEEEDYEYLETGEEQDEDTSESEPGESGAESEDEDRPCENVTSSSFEFRKCDEQDEGENDYDDDIEENQDLELNSEVAVDDIIDEAMGEALKDEIVMPPPPPPPTFAVTVDSRYCNKSISSSVSSTGSFGSTDSQPSARDDNSILIEDKSPRYSNPSQSNEDSEVALMHTVSFYRRQKQEKRTTPVKKIVRRETVSSPPSPERDRTKEIQERIKTLQEEILAQQTVIKQTSQALNLCMKTEEFSGSTEQVECERLLLIATQRRQACIGEVQRLKSLLCSGKKLVDDTGTLILNDIRLPLKQDSISSQKNGKNNDDVHYFICLVRHGHQVIVTQMLSAQDGEQGSLCFTNHITLHELPPDFSVAFEVYTLKTKKEVLPHDRKYHIRKDHSKMRLTPKGKKGDSKLMSPSVSSPGGPDAVRSPNFSVVGFTRFTLQNCNRQIYTLEKVPFSSPLDGVLKLNMHLHAEHKIAERGFLTMFDDVSGFGAWHRRWCLLDGKDVAFWKYPDDEKRKEAMLVINLKQCITGQVKLVSRDVCARPHTFELVTVRPQAKGDKNTLISRSVNTLTTTKYLLSADTKEERILWCNRLNDALMNVRKWDPSAMRPIEVRQDK